MALCWPSLLLLLALIIQTAATNYTLTSELTNFVPPCAQDCFKSFLDINFPSTPCSTTPTLDCLCSHNTTSGYTVGEGAVQCIISEDNIGFCQGNDAKENVAIAAFNMCSGQANALPNTHGTITATLIVETSMPSIALIAPTATTTPGSTSTSSSILQPTRSGVHSSTAIGSPSKSSPASSTISAQATSETAATAASLSKPQLVGIVVAAVGASCIGLGALVLFLCLRRRKQRRARESDLIPFQLDPPKHLMRKSKYKYMSFKGPLDRKPGGTRNGIAAKVAPPVPPRLDTSIPNLFSRRSIRPDTIGIAISPESKYAIEQRERKLLPEKPTLTLKMPQSPPPGGISFSQIVSGPGFARQSAATNFEEEEFNSADTAVNADNDSWGRKSTENILDDSPKDWQVRLVEPEAAKAGNFVDGGTTYHWRPPQASRINAEPSPDYFPKPLNISQGVGSFSQPRRPEQYTRPQEQALQLTIPLQDIGPITASSSVYSTHPLMTNQPRNNAKNNVPKLRKSYRQSGTYDARKSGHESAGSMTSFDSLDSGFLSPEGSAPNTASYELSPVVESPTSPGGGKSPVTYPRIPGRLSASTVRMIPPPSQPDFGQLFGSGTRPQDTAKPWRQAELAAQRERERISRQPQQQAQVATRELQTRLGMQTVAQVPIPAPTHHRKRSSQSTLATPNLDSFPQPPARPVRSQTAPVPLANPNWQPHPQPQPYPPQHILKHKASQLHLPHVVDAQPRSSSQLSQHSVTSKTSTSSSLLAKRLGEQKAATLVLKDQKEREEERRKWRVLKKEEIALAKKSGWRPTLGRERADGGGGGGSGGGLNSNGLSSAGGLQSGGMNSGGMRTGASLGQELQTPKSPGWSLTPTRRGDELFLSVL